MKKLMTLTGWLVMAAALMIGITACSSSSDIIDEQPTPTPLPDNGKYTMTVKASKGGVDTRALVVDGNDLKAFWDGNEVVTVKEGDNVLGTLAAIPDDSDNTTATLSGKLDNAPTGTEVKLELCNTDYDNQDGTLNYIASHCDYATATITVTVSGKTITASDADFVNKNAITKFTFKDGDNVLMPSQVIVTPTTGNLGIDQLLAQNGISTFTFNIPDETYANGNTDLFFAMPGLPSSMSDYSSMVKLNITATVGSNIYTYTRSGYLFAPSKYYSITVKMVNDLSAKVNANTYIVSSAGKYRFDATVKGNGGFDPMTGTTATKISKSDIAGVKVLWELFGQGRAIKHDGTSYDISYDDGYVYFSTPSTFVSGNCHVAVVDASDNILWSWLIWATPEPGEQTANNEKFMDRNLGSINVEYCSRGFLYQWGRKDPFPSTKYNNYNPYDYVPARMTCHGLTNASQSVSYTILHPTTYIYNVAWVTEDDYKTNLWSDTEKTIYDPCPAGWRVPTNLQMANFHSKIGLGTLPNTGFVGNCSSGDFGYGNPGTGYYWSSTGVNRLNAKAFCNDTRSNQNWPINEGYAIRPVKE